MAPEIKYPFAKCLECPLAKNLVTQTSNKNKNLISLDISCIVLKEKAHIGGLMKLNGREVSKLEYLPEQIDTPPKFCPQLQEKEEKSRV